MAIMAGVLLVAALAQAMVLVVRDRRAAFEAVTTAQGNLALSLEREILRNIDIYDLSLRAAASGLKLLDPSMDAAAQKAILFDGSIAAQHFLPIFITDRLGTVLRDAGSATPRVPNVADRPYFEPHRTRDDLGLLVMLVQRGGVTGRPYLSLTRRVSGADGGFEGTVAGGLSLDYFRDIFSRFSLPSGGAIALVGYDGRLVAGFPYREDMAGRDVTAGGLVDQARLADFSSFETKSVIDGVTRVATVRRLGRLPFFVVVGEPSAGVYADWFWRAWGIGAGMFVFVGTSVLLMLALLRELAGRQRAQRRAVAAGEALRASEQRLGTYVDHLADGVLAIGRQADGTFAYERVNAAAASMLGIRPEDAIGRRPREVWPAPLADAVEQAWRECLEANEPLRYERTIDGRDGKRVLRVVMARVQDPSSDGGGPVNLMLASLRDVTDTVATEAQLRQAQRMEAVGQLTAGVAHDLNNMLQTQFGALEILLHDVQDMPRARECAELALAVGERGSSLTHSLLSFSRQQHLAPQAVPVEALLERLRQMLSRTLGPRIELRVHAEAGTKAAFADPAQLDSALLNLVLNARDAMPEGGVLQIEARNGRPGEIAPDGMVPGETVVLAVSDTGGGMTPEVAGRACEPFFTTKEVGKGSGLGLSMVQGFVQQSGGAMRIQSKLGQGTRLELWLPWARETIDAGNLDTAAVVAHAGARWRVLLVDDEPDVLAVTAELLDDRGFEVVQAMQGPDALALLETERAFDILVTDYMMPGIDGGELIRRAVRICPELPALVLTGYAESDILAKLPPHVEVARKPIRGDSLAKRVTDILRRDPSFTGHAKSFERAVSPVDNPH